MAAGTTSNHFAAARDGATLPQDKPTLRADQVGSLLRPHELKDARTQHEAARPSAAQLREVEDRCVRAAIARQEETGLRAATDGEYRRAYWHYDFVAGLDGVELYEPEQKVAFSGGVVLPHSLRGCCRCWRTC